MTLLEALVALVVVGIGATGFLGLFQQSARSTRDAEEWTRVVAYAESGMEAASLGAVPRDSLAGYARTIASHPSRGMIELDVTVVSPSGRRFTLRRLVDGGPLGTGAAR